MARRYGELGREEIPETPSLWPRPTYSGAACLGSETTRKLAARPGLRASRTSAAFSAESPTNGSIQTAPYSPHAADSPSRPDREGADVRRLSGDEPPTE